MGDSRPRRLEEHAAREIGLALLLLALALVQSALLPRPGGLALNLLLLLTICHALLAGPASAARWAFYGGLSLDICAGSALGSHALALLAATLIPALVLVRLSRRNWLLPILGASLGATAYYVVLGLITTLLVARVDPHTYGVVVALPGIFLAVIPALPLFLVLRWLEMRRRGEVQVDVY
jgi:hypothetical protein